jgi:thiamine kinase-like enzyme
MNKDIKLIRRLNRDWKIGKIKIKKAGGQTNRNYIVEFKNKKYFVRLPWEGVIDRAIEGKNILALSRCQKLKEILPAYYIYILKKKNILNPKSKEIFDLPDGTMMTEYVEGKIFDFSLFKLKKYQEKLARMFYIFHASNVRFANRYNSFRDEIAKYRVAAEKHSLPEFIDKNLVSNLKKIEKEADGKIPVLRRGVPAHNDFLFQNIIVGNNGRLYLLDFEYAGMNEKGGILYDFGYFFADNVFRNPPVNKELYDKFLNVADKIYNRRLDRKQIYWLALSTPLLQIWWGLLRYFSVKTKKEKKFFKDYILKRTKGIDYILEIIKKNEG